MSCKGAKACTVRPFVVVAIALSLACTSTTLDAAASDAHLVVTSGNKRHAELYRMALDLERKRGIDIVLVDTASRRVAVAPHGRHIDIACAQRVAKRIMDKHADQRDVETRARAHLVPHFSEVVESCGLSQRRRSEEPESLSDEGRFVAVYLTWAVLIGSVSMLMLGGCAYLSWPPEHEHVRRRHFTYEDRRRIRAYEDDDSDDDDACWLDHSSHLSDSDSD